MIDPRFTPKPEVRITHPDWSRDAALYQLNTRQFTDEGTFRSAEQHLERIQALGATILWLMPINPIGEVNRKGSLGSPYAVKDYYGVNPELGTLDDLRHFVDRAHDLGLRVIIDWVANHTAWDNHLVQDHPEWYSRDWNGRFHPTPWWDWEDIIDLNYQRPELRQYMTEAMCYWVREADVDGFRCDVAGFVPTDFWNTVRAELDAIKPVFMLAEWQTRDLLWEAFDAVYGWSWYDAVHHVAQGHCALEPVYVYYAWNEKAYPRDGMQMTFVSNHDKNSWEGTEFEQFGDGVEAAIVLSVVGEGIPLIYNGQEAGYDKRLEFFERDPIQWRDHSMGDLYRTLLTLKKHCRALWNGAWGARMIRVPNSAPDRVLSFVRQDLDAKVLAVFNFSPNPVTVGLGLGLGLGLGAELFVGDYVEHFSGTPTAIGPQTELSLTPWDYRVFVHGPGSRTPVPAA